MPRVLDGDWRIPVPAVMFTQSAGDCFSSPLQQIGRLAGITGLQRLNQMQKDARAGPFNSSEGYHSVGDLYLVASTTQYHSNKR